MLTCLTAGSAATELCIRTTVVSYCGGFGRPLSNGFWKRTEELISIVTAVAWMTGTNIVPMSLVSLLVCWCCVGVGVRIELGVAVSMLWCCC